MNQIYISGFREQPVSKEEVLETLPEGWYKIVDKLIDDLFKAGWDGRLRQTKEKFGSLRFYINEGTEEIFYLIAKAEEFTSKVCIICGEPATGTTQGWFTYRCDKHLEGKV